MEKCLSFFLKLLHTFHTYTTLSDPLTQEDELQNNSSDQMNEEKYYGKRYN